MLTTKLKEDLIDQLMNKAQDLDVAILNYTLGEDFFFLDALSLYQNGNGGFGKGLFIDNYNPNSTAFVTFYALCLLYIFKVDNVEYDKMIKKALTYLYHKAKREDNLLVIGEESNNNYAHSSFFHYPQSIDYKLTIGVIGITLLLVDNTNPYYKLAIEEYNKIKDRINIDDFNKDNVIYLAILKAGLDKINISNNIDVSSLIDIKNVIEVAEFIDVDKDILNRALKALVDTINSNGLWDYRVYWGNTYPEADVAELKWSFRKTALNFYYLNKYKFVEYE